MNSVHAYSIGNEKKMPFKPYDGIDSFEYQPESSFMDKSTFDGKHSRQGELLKGTTLGILNIVTLYLIIILKRKKR